MKRTESWKGVVALALIAGSYMAVSTRAQAQADAKAAAVLKETRKALGGEQKITALKGLSMRADYRRELSGGMAGGGGMTIVVAGGGGGATGGAQQTTGRIEIDLALPDKYLRADIGSAAFGMTRTEGFEASRPFVELVPNSPGMRVMADNPAADPARATAALRRSQSDIARLFLGLTGSTQPGFVATYTYAGQAESPDGKADIIDVSGPDDFKVRLYIDTASHLPLMLSYMEPEPRVVMRTATRPAAGREGGPGRSGEPPAGATVVTPAPGAPAAGTPHPGTAAPATGSAPALAGLSDEQRNEIARQMKEAEATPPKLVEYRLFFSDYQPVDGLMLPHRIARGLGAKTIEEWDITSYKVNPSINADRFKVGR